MPDPRSNVVAVLREELAAEAAAGFPRLMKVPQTDIIWFLDSFAGLASTEQEALLDGLAQVGALSFFPGRVTPADLQELESRHPALARFRAPRKRMGYKGGPGTPT